MLVAQSTVNEKIAAIKQALLDAGVQESEINTDSINIYANYDYSENTEVIVGYTANNTLSVRTTDIDNGWLADRRRLCRRREHAGKRAVYRAGRQRGRASRR